MILGEDHNDKKEEADQELKWKLRTISIWENWVLEFLGSHSYHPWTTAVVYVSSHAHCFTYFEFIFHFSGFSFSMKLMQNIYGPGPKYFDLVIFFLHEMNCLYLLYFNTCDNTFSLPIKGRCLVNENFTICRLVVKITYKDFHGNYYVLWYCSVTKPRNFRVWLPWLDWWKVANTRSFYTCPSFKLCKGPVLTKESVLRRGCAFVHYC